MKHSRIAWLLLAGLLVTAALAPAKKKDPDANTRTVQGTVTDVQNNAIDGAVVQLKNTKTLQIRSFITKDHGSYFFYGLSPDVDYELQASYNAIASPTKTLSSFDSRKKAIINLELKKK